MKTTRLVAWVAVVAGLAGCASQTRQDAFRQQADACRASYSVPALDPIRQKIPTLAGLAQPTLAMVTDSSRADDAEKVALVEYDRLVIKCAAELVKLYGQLGPEYAAAFHHAVLRSQANRLALYKGEITFGEHAFMSGEQTAQLRSTMADLERRRQQMAAQQEIATAASLGTAAQVMQASQPVFAPMTATR